MNKLLLALLLTVSFTVNADPLRGYVEHHGHGYRGPVYVQQYHNSTGDVLIPMVVGGVVGYALSNATQPKQVIVQQPQVVQQVQQPTPLYRKDTIYDANCSCYKDVFTQVQ